MTEPKRLVELALKGLQAERAKIDEEIAELTAQLKGGRLAGSSINLMKPAAKQRPPMTAAQKKLISQTMKKRWAERERERGGGRGK